MRSLTSPSGPANGRPPLRGAPQPPQQPIRRNLWQQGEGTAPRAHLPAPPLRRMHVPAPHPRMWGAYAQGASNPPVFTPGQPRLTPLKRVLQVTTRSEGREPMGRGGPHKHPHRDKDGARRKCPNADGSRGANAERQTAHSLTRISLVFAITSSKGVVNEGIDAHSHTQK